jgi:hypothetical protein
MVVFYWVNHSNKRFPKGRKISKVPFNKYSENFMKYQEVMVKAISSQNGTDKSILD